MSEKLELQTLAFSISLILKDAKLTADEKNNLIYNKIRDYL